METFLLGSLYDAIMGNPEVVAMILSVTGTSWVASIITVFTKTRKSKWYKIIEILALVWGKAKEKHKLEK